MSTEPALPQDSLPAGSDVLTLRDDVRRVEIGAFESERGTTQRVRFGITLALAPAAGGAADTNSEDVDAILSYDCLPRAIDTALATRRFDLLETLAQHIADDLLARPRARHVTVSIEKLDRGAFAVGVEITRHARTSTPPRPVRATSPLRPWIAPAPTLTTAPRAAAALVALHGGPGVFVPVPLDARPGEGRPEARAQIDLLAQDQAAWLLSERLPTASVAATLTEIEAVLQAGRLVLWAPAALLRRTPGGPFLSRESQRAWLAARLNGTCVAPPVPARAV